MRVGLTGGLASGKSTVAERLRAAGLVVIDADRIVSDLYLPGELGAEAVRELFGDELLLESGAVDRTLLAARVFSDPDALSRLEERIHPLVRAAFSREAEKSPGPIVLEGTLLVEAGYGPDFDLLVTVEAPRDERLARAVARGLSPEQAEARLAAQGDGELRRRAADRIISNDGSLADLFAQADELAAEILGERVGEEES